VGGGRVIGARLEDVGIITTKKRGRYIGVKGFKGVEVLKVLSILTI
jgi:hypothetical protein